MCVISSPRQGPSLEYRPQDQDVPLVDDVLLESDRTFNLPRNEQGTVLNVSVSVSAADSPSKPEQDPVTQLDGKGLCCFLDAHFQDAR